MSVEGAGWEWSAEIKSVLDKAVSEVNRLQAAEEGVVSALEGMLDSDDLRLENSSVSSAAAESLTRVHFQLQQASGRENGLVKQVNDLVQRQIDLEVRRAELGFISCCGALCMRVWVHGDSCTRAARTAQMKGKASQHTQQCIHTTTMHPIYMKTLV